MTGTSQSTSELRKLHAKLHRVLKALNAVQSEARAVPDREWLANDLNMMAAELTMCITHSERRGS